MIVQITLVPFVKESRIVPFRLSLPPHIKRLVHHQQPHPITQIQQFRSRRIVRTSYGIHAHFLHYTKLPLCRRNIEGRAERAEVVVQAYTVDFHSLAVQRKAFLRLKCKGTEACCSLVFIADTPAVQKSHFQSIKIRAADTPQPRILHLQCLLAFQIRPKSRTGERNPLSVRVEKFSHHLHTAVRVLRSIGT